MPTAGLKPGDLCRVPLRADLEPDGAVLWQHKDGSGNSWEMTPRQVGLVLARHRDKRRKFKYVIGASLGDQVLVLVGRMFGWAETRYFEKV